MNKSGRTGCMPSCGRLLLSAVGCSALALGIGFCFAKIWIGPFGLVSVSLMLLAVPAGVFGFLARRVFLGALAAPLFGLAGAVGFALRASPNISRVYADAEDLLILFAILGSLGGLVCVAVGSLCGLIGDQCSKAAADTSPPLPPLPPDAEAEV